MTTPRLTVEYLTDQVFDLYEVKSVRLGTTEKFATMIKSYADQCVREALTEAALLCAKTEQQILYMRPKSPAGDTP